MELCIKKLSIKGDGVIEVSDGSIYAPFTLPNELVAGDIQDGQLVNTRIIKPSDARVKAPCTHFRQCGGCTLQHASDDFVSDWKAEIINNALGIHGIQTNILPTITSPARTRKRATFTGRKTKKGVMVGFNKRASTILVEIPNCITLHPSIINHIPTLEALTELGATRKNEVTLAITESINGPDISVTSPKALDGHLQQKLGQLCEQYKVARLIWNSEVLVYRAEPKQSFNNIPITPHPDAFLQATDHGQEVLIAQVKQILRGTKHIVDLFSGCGTFTLPMLPYASVWSLESSNQALEALDAAWRNSEGLKPLRIETRDLFRNPVLAEDFASYDGVIIDPPRAGAQSQILELAKSSIGKVAYVSCNPITFARDAKTLISNGYELNFIQPVDQFRWSAHVELVSEFTKK